MRSGKTWAPVPHLQPTLDFSQDNPQENVWYTVLDTTALVRLISVGTMVLDDGEVIQLQITTDLSTFWGEVNQNAFAWYFWRFNPTYANRLTAETYELSEYRSIFLESETVKVEVRKISITGTGTLHCHINWSRW